MVWGFLPFMTSAGKEIVRSVASIQLQRREAIWPLRWPVLIVSCTTVPYGYESCVAAFQIATSSLLLGRWQRGGGLGAFRRPAMGEIGRCCLPTAQLKNVPTAVVAWAAREGRSLSVMAVTSVAVIFSSVLDLKAGR